MKKVNLTPQQIKDNAVYVGERMRRIPAAWKLAEEQVIAHGERFQTVVGVDGQDYQFCNKSFFFHRNMAEACRGL